MGLDYACPLLSSDLSFPTPTHRPNHQSPTSWRDRLAQMPPKGKRVYWKNEVTSGHRREIVQSFAQELTINLS